MKGLNQSGPSSEVWRAATATSCQRECPYWPSCDCGPHSAPCSSSGVAGDLGCVCLPARIDRSSTGAL